MKRFLLTVLFCILLVQTVNAGLAGGLNYINDTSYFTHDTTSPIVSLETANNTVFSSVPLSLNYNVTDATTSINNCTLYLDQTSNSTDTSITESTTQTFSASPIERSAGYNWTVGCTDSAGNSANASNSLVFTVRIPPVISGVSSGNPEQTSAVISWTTDEVSNSTVFYGTLTGTYTNTTFNSSTGTSNSVSLTSLSCNTIYYFLASSTDSLGSSSNSSENSFSTDPCSQTPTGGSLMGGGGGSNVEDSNSTGFDLLSTASNTITYSVKAGFNLLEWMRDFFLGPPLTLSITEDLLAEDGKTYTVTTTSDTYDSGNSKYVELTGLPHWTLWIGIIIILLGGLLLFQYGLLGLAWSYVVSPVVLLILAAILLIAWKVYYT
jgi:hypothetical protein